MRVRILSSASAAIWARGAYSGVGSKGPYSPTLALRPRARIWNTAYGFFSIEEFYLEVTGSGESHIRCVRKGGKLYLTAQDAAFTVEFKSFLEEGSMDSMDFSAGETCTIRIRDGGMEFVR